MLVQALAEYADTYLSEQLSNEVWEEKPVPYLIALDSAGTFLNLIPHNVQATRGKKTVSVPAPLPVPRSPVPRVAGLHPLLAADYIKYVLGVGPWTTKKQEQNSQKLHEAFVHLIRESAVATDDDGLKAASAFYSRPDQVDAARKALKDTTAESIIALALHNSPLVRRPAIQACWTKFYDAAARSRVAKGGHAECLISGKVGPIAPIHAKIKGLVSLGGRAEVALMSFDKEAFCSYGWEQNSNSPVAADRAMAYVLALNDLLRPDGGHRRDIAGVGFIFWTKEKTEVDPMSTINRPDPARVQQLLSLNRDADPDPNMFYMAGLAGNGARMLIRYWVAKTLSDVKVNLKCWFEGLQVTDLYTGKLSAPPSLWQLQSAIDRKGEPPAERVVSLVRRAIEGQPLGYRVLASVLARLRAEPRKRRESVRAGLIRLCLNDNIQLRNKGERFMHHSLDTGQRHEAYLCGRLMAVYESLQYRAVGKVNQNVIDRYYTLASTYPEIAFPRLKDLSNKHLCKLRRPPHYGAMVRISQEIDRLHVEIEEASGFKYPKALDLDGQGRFALGYHHQRSHQMEQARVNSDLEWDQPAADEPQENS